MLLFNLYRYIAPEQVPVQYGGLSKEKDPDFTSADAVAEITIKPSAKQVIEIPVTEVGELVTFTSSTNVFLSILLTKMSCL